MSHAAATAAIVAALHDKDTPKHAVVEWYWSYVSSLDAAKKAELLKWATGSARCPLGGFAKLHGRDGVLRPFTLTSVELAQCAYPLSEKCSFI